MSIREKVKSLSGKRTTKTVEIDGVGSVRLRSLSEADFQSGISKWFRDDKFEVIEGRQKYDRVKSIQMCLVEDDDSLSFSDKTEDLDALVSLDASIIDALFEETRKLTQAPAKN